VASEAEVVANRTKWCDALRSGKYRKTAGWLRRTNSTQTTRHRVGFCCLGVAADLLDPNGWDGDNHILGDDETGRLSTYAGALFGIDDADQMSLARINDSSESTFVGIANMIESLPLRLEQD
jgi:hypothetical protein